MRSVYRMVKKDIVMDELWNELSVKLNGYITTLKKTNPNGKYNNNFPRKNKISSTNEAQINIIFEQSEKILNLRENDNVLGLNLHQDDKVDLLKHFLADLEQFSTENGLYLGGNQIFTYGQSRIAEHALFHLAASPVLPNTYRTIEQHAGKVFDVYSIPFKIRVSLENKIKSIIGFESIDVVKLNGDNVKSYDFPFTYILNELIYLKCLDLPCSLENIKNIYQWSCNFCHTGEKEPIWLSLKALEIISPLFIFKYQKEYEISVMELWHRYVFSEEYMLEKLSRYKGFVNPIYHLKKGWSINKLQGRLNKPIDVKRKYKRKDAKEVLFNLSETQLSEVSYYFCDRTREYY